MLSGYKTYIVAAVALISFAASYLVGDITLAAAAQGGLTAVLGATLRNGMK